jgi:multicomponent Na+:H+ antiporter subunit D
LARYGSRLAIRFDEDVVDGSVNGIGRAHLAVSAFLRRAQTGRISNYALAVVLGVILAITILVAVF